MSKVKLGKAQIRKLRNKRNLHRKNRIANKLAQMKVSS